MDLMFPLVTGFGNSHNSLDVVSNLNSSRSDWVLVYATRKLSVLKHKDMHKEWTFNAGPIHRFEALRSTETPNNLEFDVGLVWHHEYLSAVNKKECIINPAACY